MSQSSEKNWKRSSKIYMHQNTPNYNSNIHFGPPGYPGGASGAQNLKIAVPGGYLKDRIWVLWNFCPIFGYLTLFGWLKLEILTLVVYHTPLRRADMTNGMEKSFF